jgi:predicted Zn-dependent protease
MIPWTDAGILAWLDAQLDPLRDTECEIVLRGGRQTLTRFARGEIHQHVDESRILAQVRVAVSSSQETRIGAVSTSDLRGEAVATAVRQARQLALHAPAMPRWGGMAAPQESNSRVQYDSGSRDRATAEASPALRADLVTRMVLPARRLGWDAAGHLRIVDGAFTEYGDPDVFAVGNTWGIRRVFQGSGVDAVCHVTTPGGATGWAGAWGLRLGQVSAEGLAREALATAQRMQRRETLPSGRYTVLLEPPAVAELLRFALPSFSARAAREGRSWLSRHMGARLADERVSLHCDPRHPMLMARPFDAEGVATQPVELIRSGWHRDLTVGYFESGQADRACNGYSPLQPTGADGAPRSAILEAGSGTVDELQARHPEVLRVRRFWYSRFTDPMEARVTGLTRDGFWQVQDGTAVHGLVDMRFHAAVFEVLQQVVDASESVRVGDMLVPALVVRDFRLDITGLST